MLEFSELLVLEVVFRNAVPHIVIMYYLLPNIINQSVTYVLYVPSIVLKIHWKCHA